MTQKASSDGTTYRDRSETGTLNEADEAVTLAVEEQDSFACQITTGLTGTLVAEVSVDGGTTYAATEFASKAGGATSSSLVNPSTGAYDILRTAGCTHVRVRCSAYTSGSAVVVLRGTETPPAVGAGLADIESAVDGLEALLGRWTPFRDSSVDNSSQTMKASPGTLGHIAGFNKNAEDCWLHFYDAADVSGTPTYSLLIPKGDGTARGGAEVSLGAGLTFATAIRYNAVTTASGANPGIALEMVAGYI